MPTRQSQNRVTSAQKELIIADPCADALWNVVS